MRRNAQLLMRSIVSQENSILKIADGNSGSLGVNRIKYGNRKMLPYVTLLRLIV